MRNSETVKKKLACRLAALIISLALLPGLLPGAALADGEEALPEEAPGSSAGFPDVPDDAWYGGALSEIRYYMPDIIDGIMDEDGVVRFHPDDPVLRGEFLKMSMTAAVGFTSDSSRDDVHWAGRYYTIAMENGILVPDAGSGSEPMFPCTYEDLQAPVSRYEMAVILLNVCLNMQGESTVRVSGADRYISDYGEVADYSPANGTSGPGSYVRAVEQCYGKGLLSGYPDGSFRGAATLTRAEAVTVIFRQLNWGGARTRPPWAVQSSHVITAPGTGGGSFARWLQDGHLTGGSVPDAEARRRLFGDEEKYFFSSAEEAEPYMCDVTVPIWAIDESGTKYGTRTTLTVNRQVADEVALIFQQIYNDPECFPIHAYSVGGARYGGDYTHSWGCAIDINPVYNCECRFTDGGLNVTCGDGWRPEGTEGRTWVGHGMEEFYGTLESASPYSIAPGSSVVRAFAAYGWGWGGSGTNDVGEEPIGWKQGSAFDFMHFSVLPSGG